MNHSDVEELARKVELTEPRDVWGDLPSDYRQALCSFAALVLEKAAEVCKDKHREHRLDTDDYYNGQGEGAKWCAQQLRAMSAALQSGDRG